jgi:hypothetical protein
MALAAVGASAATGATTAGAAAAATAAAAPVSSSSSAPEVSWRVGLAAAAPDATRSRSRRREGMVTMAAGFLNAIGVSWFSALPFCMHVLMALPLLYLPIELRL